MTTTKHKVIGNIKSNTLRTCGCKAPEKAQSPRLYFSNRQGMHQDLMTHLVSGTLMRLRQSNHFKVSLKSKLRKFLQKNAICLVWDNILVSGKLHSETVGILMSLAPATFLRSINRWIRWYIEWLVKWIVSWSRLDF